MMYKDDLFDEISRTLANPMQRRHAFKLIAGAFAASLFPSLLPKRALAAGGAATVAATKVANIFVVDTEVRDVIDLLRGQYNVPVSFIEASEDILVNITVGFGTVSDVLNQIVKQNPIYQWVETDGRLIVFPNYSVLSQTVNEVNISDVPRFQAAEQYIEHLKMQLPDFQGIAGVALKGNPQATIYTTPVTLSSQASVLRHFIELLGDDPLAAFYLMRAETGSYLFLLARAEPATEFPSLAAAAACRSLSATYTNPTNVACTGGNCGQSIVYDITGVTTCPGDNCAGMTLTEVVTTDNGCTPGPVRTGAGCPIGSGNTIPPPCTDTYTLCAPLASLPNTCTETYTQLISVGGQLVQTCFIAFKFRLAGGTCSATVVRTCSSANRVQQCCNDNSGNPIFCNVGDVCIGGKCCPRLQVCGTGSAAVCCGVGQRCLNGRCFGSNCTGPSTCGVAPACGSGGCVCFLTVEGLGFCHLSQLCAGLQTCSSSAQCPVGYACVVTCCGPQSICIQPCPTGAQSLAPLGTSPTMTGPTTTGR